MPAFHFEPACFRSEHGVEAIAAFASPILREIAPEASNPSERAIERRGRSLPDLEATEDRSSSPA